jgi:hypothetical protein
MRAARGHLGAFLRERAGEFPSLLGLLHQRRAPLVGERLLERICATAKCSSSPRALGLDLDRPRDFLIERRKLPA